MSTVEKRNTQYDSINGQQLVIKSYINKHKLKYIIENYESLQNKTSARMGHEYAEKQLRMAKEMYKNTITDGNGDTYIISTFEQNDRKKGRYFSTTPSLQNISREIRHTISERYIDIDIKNCHPSVLLDYCNKNKIPCGSLHDYVVNRQSYFNDLQKTLGMSKSEAKMHILTMMNADMNENCKHSDKMNSLRREFIRIRNEVVQKHTDIVEYVKANIQEDEVCNGVSLKADNITGRTMNHLLCEIENNILMTCLKTVVNHKLHYDKLNSEYKPVKGSMPITFEIGAPIHDGFMMSMNGCENTNDGFLSGIKCLLEETVKKELDIDNIVFEEKPMTDGWHITDDMLKTIDMTDDDIIYDDKMLNKAIYGDHKETAELFKALYGQENIRIINHEKTTHYYHWNLKTCLWEEESGLSFIRYFSILNKLFEKHLKEAERDLINCKEPKVKDADMQVIVDGVVDKKATKEKAKQMHTDFMDKKTILKNRVNELKKYLKNLSNVTFLKNCKEYYCSYAYDKEFDTNLNRAEYELPIANCKKIHLKTKEITERTRKDMFSFSLDVSYKNDETEREHVMKFFTSLCSNDIPFTEYLIKFLGYSLSGDLSDTSINIFYGGGSNGKSTLFEIMKKMLKKYYTSLSEGVFIKNDKRGTAATPELIPLKDARLGVLSESNEGEQLNEARLKSVSGGDEIYARDLYKSAVTFTSKTKLVLVTNNLPIFNVKDGGMLRRIKLFPFTNRFTRTPESDKFIDDIKNKYLDSLFSMLIDAGAEYHSGKRLVMCDFMNNQLKDYISDLDFEQRFFEENYNIIEESVYESSLQKTNLRILRNDVYRHFQDYLRENVIHKKYTQKQFTEILTFKKIIQIPQSGYNFLCLTSKNDNHGNVMTEL